MDATTEHLSDYACRLAPADLTPAAIHQVKRTLIDTSAARWARWGASRRRSPGVCARVDGSPFAASWRAARRRPSTWRPSPAPCSSRYLDCNDTYAARGTGHPSDMIPPSWPSRTRARPTPRGRHRDRRGLRGVLPAGRPGAARGLGPGDVRGHRRRVRRGEILGLDRRAMGHAISVAIRQACPRRDAHRRARDVEGCATAAANRAGLFAAELAAEGMTGPGHRSRDATDCGSTWGSSRRSGSASEAATSPSGSPARASRPSRPWSTRRVRSG